MNDYPPRVETIHQQDLRGQAEECVHIVLVGPDSTIGEVMEAHLQGDIAHPDPISESTIELTPPARPSECWFCTRTAIE